DLDVEDHVLLARLTRVVVTESIRQDVVFIDIRLIDADVEYSVVALHPVEVAELRHLGLSRLGLDRCLRLGLLSGSSRRDVDSFFLSSCVLPSGILSNRAYVEG